MNILALALQFAIQVLRMIPRPKGAQRTHLPHQFRPPFICVYCGRTLTPQEFGQPCPKLG